MADPRVLGLRGRATNNHWALRLGGEGRGVRTRGRKKGKGGDGEGRGRWREGRRDVSQASLLLP